MANNFKQDIKVLSSQTDDKCRLGVLGAFSLLQDNMCEYFRALKCDGLNLVPTHNCFFVVAKTKVHFVDDFQWLDRVQLSTEDASVSRVAVNLHTTFLNNLGKVGIDCMQEMCVMDCTSRRLRMVDTTPFPMQNDNCERVRFFEKLPHLEDGQLVGEEKVCYTNIDFYHHTNNVEYVRMLLNYIPSDLKDMQIKDFEIHYLSESKLGDVLKIYYCRKNDALYFEICCDGRDVTRVKITY